MDSNIPGVVVQFPNHHVQTLKEAPWADVLGLLGSNGEEIMMRLLFDCGLFASIGAKKGIFYQLSGALFAHLILANAQYIMLINYLSLLQDCLCPR